MADSPTGPSKVFISYSHRDKEYLDRLQEHLKPHVRAGTIPLWVDTHLKPGDDWEAEIKRALESAQVAILLVSFSFLASDFVVEEELPKLLAVAEGRGAHILPVILTPCSFRRTKLSRFQAVNNPARPLSGLSQHEQDVIWEQVVDAVLDTLDAAIGEPEPEPTPAETSPGSVQGSLPPSPSPAPPRPVRQGSTRDKFPGLLRELITSTPGLVLCYSAKKFTSFMPQEWDVPTLGGVSEAALGFVFDRKSDRLKLNLIISPGPLETRQRLLDMAHAKQPPFKPVHRELNNYWNTIYGRMFLTTQAYESFSDAEVHAEIRKHWKDFLERDLPQIQAAMRSEAWIWK